MYHLTSRAPRSAQHLARLASLVSVWHPGLRLKYLHMAILLVQGCLNNVSEVSDLIPDRTAPILEFLSQLSILQVTQVDSPSLNTLASCQAGKDSTVNLAKALLCLELPFKATPAERILSCSNGSYHDSKQISSFHESALEHSLGVLPAMTVLTPKVTVMATPEIAVKHVPATSDPELVPKASAPQFQCSVPTLSSTVHSLKAACLQFLTKPFPSHQTHSSPSRPSWSKHSLSKSS